MTSAARLARLLVTGTIVAALGTGRPAAADSVDAMQLGIGMGAVGALVGSTAGSTGALIGGVAGFGIGAAIGGAKKPKKLRDPAQQQAIAEERATWEAGSRAAEERWHAEQREAHAEAWVAAQNTGSAPAAGYPGRSVVMRAPVDTPAAAPVAEPATASSPDGDLVAAIQRALAADGYEPGPADGVSGRATVEAIEAYQLDHELLITGEPSAALLEHIRRGG